MRARVKSSLIMQVIEYSSLSMSHFNQYKVSFYNILVLLLLSSFFLCSLPTLFELYFKLFDTIY